MKKLVCTLISAAAIGSAQGPMRPMSAVFAALDTDRDGTLSTAEIAAAPNTLKALDKNNDGRLTADEVAPAFEGRGGRGRSEGGRGEGNGPGGGAGADELTKTLMEFDANHNGTLEKSEVPERMQGLFARGDTDHDGVLSAAEIRVLAQAQAAPAGGPEGRGPEGRDEEGRGPGGRGRGGMQFDPLLNALDTDHDGVISAAEISSAPTSLKALDTNQDGKITQDEVRPAFGRGRGGR